MNSGRSDMVRHALSWLGTPYCHGASRKGVGCDCLGLVRGIWRELRGGEPEPPPIYGASWAEFDQDERLWRALTRHLHEVPGATEMRAAQVLLFRMRDRAAARHLGIVTRAQGPHERFVHAYERHGVIESPLSAPWRRRIVARFDLV